jgi:hypothetical protein
MAGRCRTLRGPPKSVEAPRGTRFGARPAAVIFAGRPRSADSRFRTGVRLSGVLIPEVTSALDRVVAMRLPAVAVLERGVDPARRRGQVRARPDALCSRPTDTPFSAAATAARCPARPTPTIRTSYARITPAGAHGRHQ